MNFSTGEEELGSNSPLIKVFNYDSPINPEIDHDRLTKWLVEEAREEGFEIKMLNIIWTSDENLRKLSAAYKDADHYTDILTFDLGDGNKTLAGELYISPERVIDNAQAYKQTFERELMRVIIHGVLHLMGYKDITPVEKRKMRERENEALERFFSLQ